jgi:class 3 adenylate cyclase
LLQRQQARQQVNAFAEMTRAILRSALPEQLLDTALLPGAGSVAHSSRRAACVVASVHSFAQWSTGALLGDVVDALDALLTGFDRGIVAHPEVVRAMAYGDSYVAVCGLVTQAQECPLSCAMLFASFQQECGADVASRAAHPFQLRVGVACGYLVGGLVGEATKRYIVTGEALQLASAAMTSCAAGAIAVAEHDEELAHSVSYEWPDAAVATASIDDDAAPCDERSYALSKRWLAFEDPQTQALFNAAAAKPTTATKTAAAAVLLLFTLLLVIALTEHFMGLLADNALTIALLAVAAVLAAVQLAHRQLRLDWPLAATAPLLFCALATALIALALSTSRWVSLQPAFGGLAFCDLLPRASWRVMVVLLSVAVVAPLVAMRTTAWVAPPGDGPVSIVAQVVAAVVCVVLVVLQRRVLALAACVRFVCAADADAAVERAMLAADHQAAILSGLLPPHALQFVATQAAEQGGPVFTEECEQLNVLQLAFAMRGCGAGERLPPAAAFASVAEVWRVVHGAVQAADAGLLELVQATGDTFLIAGPFVDTSDQALHAAAHAIVKLLRDLNQRRKLPGAFTAVATAGAAHGSLLGTSSLAFGIFGAVMRESTALLDAAPRLPQLSNRCAQPNIAFASAAFRRQHAATAVTTFTGRVRRTRIAAVRTQAPRQRTTQPVARPAHGTAGAGAGAATTVATAAAAAVAAAPGVAEQQRARREARSDSIETRLAAGDRARERRMSVAHMSPSASAAPRDRVEPGDAFRDRLRWRVRGIGVATVACIQL